MPIQMKHHCAPDSELSPLRPAYGGHSSAVACRKHVTKCVLFDIADDRASNDNLSDSPFDNVMKHSEEQEDDHTEENDKDQNDENQVEQRQGTVSDHELMEVSNVLRAFQREEHENEYDARPHQRENVEDEESQEIKREQGVQQDGSQDEDVQAEQSEVKKKRQEKLTAAQLSEMMAVIMSISAKMDNISENPD